MVSRNVKLLHHRNKGNKIEEIRRVAGLA